MECCSISACDREATTKEHVVDDEVVPPMCRACDEAFQKGRDSVSHEWCGYDADAL